MVSSSEDGGGGDSEEGAANRAAEEAALAASFLAAEPDAVAGSPPSVRLRVLAASPEGSLSSLGSHTAAAAASAAELDAPQLPGSPHASSGRGRAAAGTSAAAPAPQPARRCDSVHLCVVRSDDQEALQQELALSRSREASALVSGGGCAVHARLRLAQLWCSGCCKSVVQLLYNGCTPCRPRRTACESCS